MDQGRELLADHLLHLMIERVELLGTDALLELLDGLVQRVAAGWQETPAPTEVLLRARRSQLLAEGVRKIAEAGPAEVNLSQLIGEVAPQADVGRDDPL